MKVALYTNSISAHQLPLSREIVKRVGEDNFRYIYTGDKLQDGSQEVASSDPWVLKETSSDRNWLETCDLLLSGNRDLSLFERRVKRGLKTYYQSERWFKPFSIGIGHRCRCFLPGRIRLLHPRYRKMAKGFVHWLNSDPNARYLAIGPWAKKDMLSLGVHPDKIRDWGYFVEPSSHPILDKRSAKLKRDTLRVLYIGRLLACKRVDTIIRAVAHANKRLAEIRSATTTPSYNSITLTIVGDGPEKTYLLKLADAIFQSSAFNLKTITFAPPVLIQQVRYIMRDHNVLVFASDATDGWGAVVNEALSEGVPVIGTYETGASAALLPDVQLFHSGHYRELSQILSSFQFALSTYTIPTAYTPMGGVERLLNEFF